VLLGAYQVTEGCPRRLVGPGQLGPRLLVTPGGVGLAGDELPLGGTDDRLLLVEFTASRPMIVVGPAGGAAGLFGRGAGPVERGDELVMAAGDRRQVGGVAAEPFDGAEQAVETAPHVVERIRFQW
jgi:hypothetical protein